MKDKGPADWRQVFALFERWQTTPSEQREALVASIHEQSPELYPQFIAMVQADAGAEAHGFMAEDALSQLPELEPQPGKWSDVRLGPWVLREPIGVGGMGQVWLATRGDNLYSGRAAVKLMHMAHASADANARFAREGEFLARLAHPRIAQLYDAGLTEDGTRYLVLEHVPGEPLDQACDRQALGIEARLRLFLQVCEAVAYAHLQRVVHRDLKPSNILVTPEGHVKLLDFGVAKIMSDAGGDIESTQLGSQWFTLDYAAPEQIENGVITTATDVFSLGVVLFRLLSGAKPHEGVCTLSDVIRKLDQPRRSMLTAFEHGDSAAIAAQRSSTVGRMRQELRGDLATIVAKCLKDVPSERYDTAQALGDDLRRYLAREPLRARPDSWGYRTRKFIERNRIQALAVTVVIATLLAGVSVSLYQQSKALREAQRRELAVTFLTNVFTKLTPQQTGSAQVSVSELLSRGWRQAAIDFDADPQVKAEIARPLGIMLSYTGEFALASEALAVSTAQMRASGQTRTNDYLRALRELGYAQLRMGDTTHAKQSFDEVLRTASGMNNPALESPLWARFHLGVIAQQSGQLELAEQQFTTVARLAKERFGESDECYLQAMDLLHRVASERGNGAVQAPGSATPAAQTNPETKVRTRYEEGVRALERGDFVAATATFKEVAPAMQQLYGMQNSDTIFANVWLSVALFSSGETAASDAAITRAYQNAVRSPEPAIQHLVAIVMGRQLARRGSSNAAAPLVAKALAYFESTPDSERYAERARLIQGEILLQQGRLAEADALLLRTQDNQLRIFGGYHRELCPTLTLRALAADLQSGPATALPLYRKARDVAFEFFAAANNPERRKTQLFLDYATWREEQSAESKSALLRTIQVYKQQLATRADFAAFDVLSNELSSNLPRSEVHDTLIALLNY